MIFILLSILVRNYLSALSIDPKIKEKTLSVAIRFLYILLFLICSLSAYSQELKYDIIKSGNKIGSIHIIKSTKDSITQMRLVSKVKTNAIIQFHLNTWENAQFKKGKLVYSSVVRELNGRKKINIQLKWNGIQYYLCEDAQQKSLQITTINNNILLLYFEEPKNINKVFSETHKKWIEIIKSGIAQYRLLLPDGNYNEFFYQNGTCSKVMVHNSFYNATFQLAQ